MQYKWKCLWTGRTGVSEFTRVQHWIFGETNGAAQRTKLRVAHELIAHWNRQQSRNWQYEFIDQPTEVQA